MNCMSLKCVYSAEEWSKKGKKRIILSIQNHLRLERNPSFAFDSNRMHCIKIPENHFEFPMKSHIVKYAIIIIIAIVIKLRSSSVFFPFELLMNFHQNVSVNRNKATTKKRIQFFFVFVQSFIHYKLQNIYSEQRI